MNISHHTIFGLNLADESIPLSFTIDTTKGGVGNRTFTIPTSGSGYNYRVNWGDLVPSALTDYTGDTSYTYGSPGVYTIEIKGSFPKFYFNNTGDKLTIISINAWGNSIKDIDQTRAFFGCINLSSIPTNSDSDWMNSITNGSFMFNGCNSLTNLPSGMILNNLTNCSLMFFNCTSLTSLPSGMELTNLNNGNQMFSGCNSLTNLPSGMILTNLNSGSNMFRGCKSLTSLPSGMELTNLTNGSSMFSVCTSLTSLPSGMILTNLTNGSYMFSVCTSLTSFPSGMTLTNLLDGSGMFSNCSSLTSFPSGMELNNLTNGTYMFSSCSSLTSLPSGMTLTNLTNGTYMFYNSPSLTSLPSGVKLTNLTNGTYMFRNVTINKTRYSQLLVDLQTLNSNNTVTFTGGNSKYNTTGKTSRDILTTTPRNWVISDGGYEA